MTDKNISDVAWDDTPEEVARQAFFGEALSDVRRSMAKLQAIEAQILSSAMDDALVKLRRAEAPSSYDLPIRSMAAELGARVNETTGTMMARMTEASRLTAQFPATNRALAAGRISGRHASVISDVGQRLADHGVRIRYERLVVERALHATPSALRVYARQVVDSLEPTTISERHARANAHRGVFLRELEDGMAELCVVASAPLVHGAFDRLTSMADAVKRARGAESPDERGLDALRADLTSELLLTGEPSGCTDAALDGIRATVQVTIPVASLTGLDDEAAMLAGHGPIPADLGRRLASTAAGWTRLFLNPRTSALLTTDRYKPTKAQRRHLAARDTTCRFPHCRRQAHRSDIDHTLDHRFGGKTDVANLAHLCRSHHVLKHHSPWKVKQSDNGVMLWTSPSGVVYGDRPEPTVRFAPDIPDSLDPPPF